VTVFGRLTDSSQDWWIEKDSWLALVEAPNPYDLRAGGFDYAFVHRDYVDGLAPEHREMLDAYCVEVVDEIVIYGPRDYRLLLDLRGCGCKCSK